MKIIDPKKLTKLDLPMVVCSDDLRGFFSFITKAHTHGNYSHVMVMHRPGFFASQTLSGYKEVPIKKYLKPRYRLKFFQYKDISDTKRKSWLELISKSLKESWWKRRYDYLGILGQLLNIRRINNPWIEYCSERVAIALRTIFKMILKLHLTPSEENQILTKDKNWKTYGYYMEV